MKKCLTEEKYNELMNDIGTISGFVIAMNTMLNNENLSKMVDKSIDNLAKFLKELKEKDEQ